MEKTYNLYDCVLEVSFSEKIVNIKTPKALKKFLSSNIEERSDLFAEMIKNDYLELIGREFDVKKESIVIEIWGHVYASYFARALKNLIDLKLIENLADFVIRKGDVIDCGEKEVDSNRLFWDILANFKGMILKFLPAKMKR